MQLVFQKKAQLIQRLLKTKTEIYYKSAYDCFMERKLFKFQKQQQY
jgi:hypothetical protein